VRRYIIRKFIWILIVILLVSPSFAQIYGAFASTGPYVSPDVRALGMGNAFCAFEGEIVGLFFNPASIAKLSNSQFNITYGYSPLSLENFGFGTSMYFSSYDLTFAVPDFGLWSSGVLFASLSPSEDLGVLYKENQLGYIMAKSLDFIGIKGVSLGVSLKRYWVDLPSPYRAEGWGLDLGILLRLFSSFKLGFSAQNLLSNIDWYNGESNTKEALSTNFKFGIAYQSKKLNVAFDLDFPSLYPHVGMEYSFDPILFRLGWNIDSPTIGFGFRSPDGKWRIDYALLYSLGIGGVSHKVGMLMNF